MQLRAILVLILGAGCMAAVGVMVGRTLVRDSMVSVAERPHHESPELGRDLLLGAELGDLWLDDGGETKDMLVSRLQGSPAVLIWTSTQCPACRDELEDWRDHANGFPVFAIGFEAVAGLDSLARGEGLTFPVLRDVDARLLEDYEATTFPTIIGVDEYGKVAYVHRGKSNSPSYVLKEMESVMRGPAVSSPAVWQAPESARFEQ